MTPVAIEPSDLEAFAVIDEIKATAMIADAMGMAKMIAPCIVSPTFEHPDAAKAVIRGAILRWNEAGTGAITTKQAGPYQQVIDSNTRRNNLFWPSEISQLEAMCRAGSTAFSIDTNSGTSAVMHSDICSVNFGSQYCSCGALLTGLSALWELP